MENVGAAGYHRNMTQVARDSLDGGLLVRLLSCTVKQAKLDSWANK